MAEKAEIDRELLDALAPKAEELVDRHLQTRKYWYPHEFVPWSLAEDFPKDYTWSPEEFPLPEEVRSALFVNLLTEDNLPFYVRDLDSFAGKEGIWRHWTGIWAFEEARHSQAMRDYIHATRLLDPIALEKAREVQVVGGKVPLVENSINGFVYVALQELATRISHFNTGKSLQEVADGTQNDRLRVLAQAGYMLLKRVGVDENYHFVFYNDLVEEAKHLNPSKVVIAIDKIVHEFKMPGTGIPDFKYHAAQIASAGIYNTAIHYEKILVPVVVNRWNLANITGLTPEAAQAQERAMNRIHRIGEVVARRAAKSALKSSAV